MKKIISLSILCFLCLNLAVVNAADKKSAKKAVDNQQVQQDNTYNVSDDYNFDNTVYITDEQLEAAKNINKIEDDNAGIHTNVINSSHFSAGTATKTWIPLNKPQE